MPRSEKIAALNAALGDLKRFLKGGAHPPGEFEDAWTKFLAETIKPLKEGYRAYWKIAASSRSDDQGAEHRGTFERELVPLADQAVRDISEWADSDSDLRKLHRLQEGVEKALEALLKAMNSSKGTY